MNNPVWYDRVWDEGYEARLSGKPSFLCPYEENTEQRKVWIIGYEYANEAMK